MQADSNKVGLRYAITQGNESYRNGAVLETVCPLMCVPGDEQTRVISLTCPTLALRGIQITLLICNDHIVAHVWALRL